MARYDSFHGLRAPATRAGVWQAARQKRRTAALILKYAPRDRPRLLEIGPGRGLFAQMCGEQFVYEGLEPNPTMGETLRRQGFNVTDGSVPGLVTTPGYDAILMDQVFEHLPSGEDQYRVLEECLGALAASGVLAIVSPDYEAWGEFFFSCDYTHNVPTSPERTRQMLFDVGFELVHEEYAGPFGLRGGLSTAILVRTIRFLDGLGVLSVAGRARRNKMMSTALRSFVTIARKRTATSD
jgi:hypothetical protein